jgi:hypothetical protein
MAIQVFCIIHRVAACQLSGYVSKEISVSVFMVDGGGNVCFRKDGSSCKKEIRCRTFMTDVKPGLVAPTVFPRMFR